MMRILEAAAALQLQVLLRFKQDFTYEEFGDAVATKRAIAERYNRGGIVIDPGGNLYERLALADVVVVSNSTVGLEAMLFDKPVLAVEDADSDASAEYVDWGAALRVTSIDEIRTGLQRALGDTAFRSQLAERQRRFLEFTFVNLHDADPLRRVRDFLRGATPGPAYT
jgi:CDP-glycerol glycerophosphotransferase (TagB/SpsB family)